MRLSDLKLLVDLAWKSRYAQCEMTVPPGFKTAARRLERAGLVVFIGPTKIGLSPTGLRRIDDLTAP
jgi:hypothetical protein